VAIAAAINPITISWTSEPRRTETQPYCKPHEAVTRIRQLPLGRCPRVSQGGQNQMGIGVSLILIAAGAILAFAVDATVSGVEIVTIGWILMAVGLAGLLLSLMFWSSWGGFGGARRRTTYVDGGPPTY
jgi:hypothetical protein